MESVLNKRIPVLRFKDDRGEEYPKWEFKTLGEVGEVIGGGTPDTNDPKLWSGSIIWFTPVEINEKYSSRSIRKISMKGLKQSSAKILPAGAVLLTTRATIGKVTITTNECTTNQGFQSFVVNGSNFSNEFLYYWLTKNVNEFIRRANGSTYLEVSGKTIKKIVYSVPTLIEQQKIADFLSSIDTRIEQLEKKKSLLEQHKKGLMQKLFSQEIWFRDERGEEYPEWDKESLGNIANFSKGKGIAKNDVVSDGDVRCIRYGELYTHYGATVSKVRSRTNLPIEKLELGQINDVLIPASGETALDIATVTCLTTENIALGGDINIVRSDQNGVFLAYYLISKKKDIAKLAQGISVIHLYSTQLKTLVLNIPSKPEQQKIANLLSSIDRKIELIKKQIDQTRVFKNGLLQQMFV